ncbi:ATP-binding protein [Robbsia sp. KACC 23696]|uniref:ATP-binding protein n=1 Tax=Robbsia sp. KACC 23696 TaxID=3149231 RepID=UPI00325BBDC6
MMARGALAPINVQRCRKVSVGVLRGNQPVVIVDPTQQILTGIVADQLLVLGHQLGLNWQVEAFESRHALEKAMEEGRIEVAAGVTAGGRTDTEPLLLDPTKTASSRSALPLKKKDAATHAPTPLAMSLPYHESRAAWISRRLLPGARPMPAASAMLRAFIPNQIADDLYKARLPAAVTTGRWLAVETQYAGLRDVALGHVEAFLGDPNALQAYGKAPLFSELQAHPLMPRVPIHYRFAVRESDAGARNLLANIDAALREQTPRMRSDIARHWNHPVPHAGSMRMRLDTTARAWIAGNAEVRVAVPRNNIPIAFQNERGQLSGLTASILEMISARTGLTFSPVYADAPDTAREIVARGDADLFLTTRSDAPVDLRRYPHDMPPTGFRTSGTERTTRPFLYVTGAIVSACETVPMSDLSALHGKRVALTRGRAISDFLAARQLHGERLLFADDERQTLELVRRGDVDAAIVYLDSASYLLSSRDRAGLCLSGTTGPSTIPIQFGTRQADTQLARIIDEALGTIPSDTLHAFRFHWYDEMAPLGSRWLDSRVLSWILGIGLTLGSASLIWNYKLRQRIRRRHHHEAKLTRRIAFLRRLIDANPIPSYVRDAAGVMIDCNRAMQQATGKSLLEMRGKRVHEADELDPDSRLKVQRGYDAIAAGAETYSENLSLCINGQQFEGCHWLVALGEVGGEFGMAGDAIHGGAMLGGWIDMTERKRMERALRLAKDEAEAANRAKVMFMAAMSHEIRTPMNVIVGVLELMATDARAPVPLKRQADLAQRCATSLMTLLNDLLEFARTEVDALRLDCHAASLHAQIDEIAEFYRQNARQKGLDLVLERDPSIPDPLVFDTSRLRQVLANLLSNAIKFTAEGRITLCVRRAVPPQELLHRTPRMVVGDADNDDAARRTVWLAISVSDTGPGIPEDLRPLLFQPFQQLSHDTFRRYGGTGMGLAISKRIIDAMQGTIDVESQEGSGSTFSLTLPFHVVEARRPGTPGGPPAAVPSGASPPSFQVPLAAGARVLIVDDHEANLLLLSTQLSQIGLRPVTTGTVTEALLHLEESQEPGGDAFDAVVTDCNMPIMDGYALARHCAQRWPALPVIGYSADGTETCLAHCLESGMRGRLVKPVTLGMLRAHLPIDDVAGALPVPTSSLPIASAPSDASEQDSNPRSKTVRVYRAGDAAQAEKQVAALLALSHQDGDFARKLIDLFEEGLSTSLPEFAAAIADQDASRLRDIAHHNKGPAAMLGLQPFVDDCSLIIQQSGDASGGDWLRLQIRYIDACTAVRHALRDVRAALARTHPPSVKQD